MFVSPRTTNNSNLTNTLHLQRAQNIRVELFEAEVSLLPKKEYSKVHYELMQRGDWGTVLAPKNYRGMRPMRMPVPQLRQNDLELLMALHWHKPSNTRNIPYNLGATSEMIRLAHISTINILTESALAPSGSNLPTLTHQTKSIFVSSDGISSQFESFQTHENA